MVHSQLVMAKHSPALQREQHSSTILELEDGEIIAAWFGGTEESSPDVAIWLARFSARDGWSEPRVAVEPLGPNDGLCQKPEKPCKYFKSTWNPVLSRSPTPGETLLFFKRGDHPSTWTGYLVRSADGGRTWGPEERLSVIGPSKNKPLLTPAGALLAPSSTESGRSSPVRKWENWVEESTDGGRTWARHGPIKFNGNSIQPALFRGKDGRIRMLARTATDYDLRTGKRADPLYKKKKITYRGHSYVGLAVGDEDGRNWGPMKPIDLPCPNSGIDAVGLANGDVLVVFNDSFERKAEGRGVLAVAVSSDDGKSWRRLLTLDDAKASGARRPGWPAEFSYPAVIRSESGITRSPGANVASSPLGKVSNPSSGTTKAATANASRTLA